jgi:hypothetical protein
MLFAPKEQRNPVKKHKKNGRFFYAEATTISMKVMTPRCGVFD